jgi:hypothetical protein
VTSHKLSDLLTPEEENQLFQSQKFDDETQQKNKLILIKEEVHKKVLEECKKRSAFETEVCCRFTHRIKYYTITQITHPQQYYLMHIKV